MATILQCPTCKRALPAAEEARAFRPFCSSRCRVADLGGWLTGAYRISRPLGEEDLDEGIPQGVVASEPNDETGPSLDDLVVDEHDPVGAQLGAARCEKGGGRQSGA